MPAGKDDAIVMSQVPPFSSASLTSISKALGDTQDGLTGTEIGQLLAECRIVETSGVSTKCKRIFSELAITQNQTGTGNHVVGFINKAVNPARHTARPDRYAYFVDSLVPVLSLCGLTINDAGKVASAPKATTLDDALGRAASLKATLERRGVHREVLAACQAELLVDNYFHAVLEAMKGIGERMRVMSGLGSDGADLANEMFAVGKSADPMFAINLLRNDSELSEQKGFVNLLVGMWGMFRNPTAHALRRSWPMSEADALDMMTTMSLVHRKLDGAVRRR